MNPAIKGIGAWNITSVSLGIDYTPSTFTKVKAVFEKVKMISKYSPFTLKLNTKITSKESIFEITIDNTTLDEWNDVFKLLEGEKFTFTPHVDRDDIAYTCFVTQVDSEWQDKIFFENDQTKIYLKTDKYI